MDKSTWTKVKLGEVCRGFKTGTLKQTELVEDGTYPVINSGREYYGRYNSYNVDEEAITLASRGEYAANIHYMNEKFWAGGLCYPYTVKDKSKLSVKYLYYYLLFSYDWIRQNLVAGGGVPALNKSDIEQFEIIYPPIEVQQQIVDILSNLDSLISSKQSSILTLSKMKQQLMNDIFNGEREIGQVGEV